MEQNAQAPEVVVALRAEEAIVSRQVVAGDTVRVETVTNEHDHAVDETIFKENDETIFKENVEVERVPVGREIWTVPEIVQDGDLTIIPVVEEVVIVTRKLFLKEEVHLRRLRTATQHQETVVLRRQEAVVTREAAAEEFTTSNPIKQEI